MERKFWRPNPVQAPHLWGRSLTLPRGQTPATPPEGSLILYLPTRFDHVSSFRGAHALPPTRNDCILHTSPHLCPPFPLKLMKSCYGYDRLLSLEPRPPRVGPPKQPYPTASSQPTAHPPLPGIPLSRCDHPRGPASSSPASATRADQVSPASSRSPTHSRPVTGRSMSSEVASGQTKSLRASMSLLKLPQRPQPEESCVLARSVRLLKSRGAELRSP